MKKLLVLCLAVLYLFSCKKDNSSSTTPSNTKLPSISMDAITSVFEDGAYTKSAIPSEGGGPILQKGVCWGITASPTVSNEHTNNGSDAAAFVSYIGGLASATKYYVRAYATNMYGTAYGTEQSIITLPMSFVTIGIQSWTREDINVVKYRNGDIIPQVQDIIQWSNLTTGAWCYNITSSGEYDYNRGKLYNWYAVTDTRGLLPAGVHVPSDAEWNSLTTYLGGESVAGGKMKLISVWEFPNTGATDNSIFQATPNGYRAENSNFENDDTNGFWWSSTSATASDAWYRNLYAHSSVIIRNSVNKRSGFSVRGIQ